jgi:hypothetical protein
MVLGADDDSVKITVAPPANEIHLQRGNSHAAPSTITRNTKVETAIGICGN